MGLRMFPRKRTEAERNTPEHHNGEIVVATTAAAIPIEKAAVAVQRGTVPPPLFHTFDPATTIMPEDGIDPEDGIPPEEGIPLAEGMLQGSPGQLDVGAEGQVTRGSPGQLDPWAENPWAEAEIGFSDKGDDPWPTEQDGGESYGEFFASQPNTFGQDDPEDGAPKGS